MLLKSTLIGNTKMPKCIYCKAHVEDTPEAGMTSDFNYYHADCGKEEAMKKWDDIYRDGDESFADFGDD
tara:strand:- start:739 stop:945 length:207 start_codon:yes stop_codon:yes gene_type:complete